MIRIELNYVNPSSSDFFGRLNLIVRLLTFTLLLVGSAVHAADREKTAYDFSFQSIEGEPLPLSAYRGQVVMVVNTASLCGFTTQYKFLQEVWSRYRDKGLVVLGVPSNDFGRQEPRSDAEIKQFCELNYGIDFPMTTKVGVKGKSAHPFYRWAVQELGTLAKPRWNFHKYIVDRDGRLAEWFATTTKPNAKKVTKAIELHLSRRPGVRD